MLLHAESGKSRKAHFGDFDSGQTDIDLLHSISVALIGEHDRVELYGKIVDAAISISGSQFGTMQLLCPTDDSTGRGGYLRLLCSRGLSPESEAFWSWVSPAAHSSCTRALKSGKRAIIADYEAWDEIAGTPDLQAFRDAGIRAAQTTPLLSRTGNLLGMISTHWSDPHQPSERDLRMLDILARQAADILERTIGEEALRESERLQKMLTGELSHRVKNMLATVQAIASQTLHSTADPSDFVERFGGRIQSMSRVHSQLSTNDWKGTRLSEIVEDQLKLGPVNESQIAASGPDVYLDATAVPKMAMILHELGTNSIKYGALSKAEGSVTIDWAIVERRIEMRWTEMGGPAVTAQIRRGFGTRLIEASVRGAGGAAAMSAEPNGVQWSISFPLPAEALPDKSAGDQVRAEHVATGLARTASNDRAQAFAPSLAGKRILVVEDEPLLAMDIAEQLEEAGAIVVGPAVDLSGALDLIDEYRFDAALLDANLDGHPVDDVARALTQADIPFVFITGYGRESLPRDFGSAELLPKPFNRSQLIDIAGKLVARAR